MNVSRGGPMGGGTGAENAVLRLLGTIREEIEQIRTKQAEIYEVVLSFKDQIHDLRSTVVEKLQGLPKSPYIAGQLVPAPKKREGVDDFRELLATYLHGAAPSEQEEADEKPVDVDLTPEPIVLEPDVDEEDEGDDDEDDEEGEPDDRPRRPELDEDTRGLQRGPERDIEPFDLNRPEGEAREGAPDDRGGDDERRGRRRRRRRGGRDRDRGPSDGPSRDAPPPAPAAEAPPPPAP